jgi:ferritin-like metal-binding protein YciE
MASEELNERDARTVAWLQEAYTKEAELEADLTQHIGLTQKDSYKKRLQEHLAETRDHKKQVERRIKALGGQVGGSGPGGLPNPAKPVAEMAGKTVSMLKGQLGMARAVMTEQVETHLRNAQEELREEHVEIALYTRIETFATAVGDAETAKLARGIRRDEERMAKFLGAELTRLVKELVRSEIPREQRPSSRRGSSSSRSGGSRSGTSRAGSSRSSGRSGGGASRSGSRGSAGRSRTAAKSASGSRSARTSSSS